MHQIDFFFKLKNQIAILQIYFVHIVHFTNFARFMFLSASIASRFYISILFFSSTVIRYQKKFESSHSKIFWISVLWILQSKFKNILNFFNGQSFAFQINFESYFSNWFWILLFKLILNLTFQIIFEFLDLKISHELQINFELLDFHFLILLIQN